MRTLDSRVRGDSSRGRSLQGSGNHDRERGRHQQQSGHEVEPTEEAAGQVLDPSDHSWSDEAAEIADRVDGRNANGGRRARQEEGGHLTPSVECDHQQLGYYFGENWGWPHPIQSP